MEDERRLAEQQWRITQTQLSEDNSRRIDEIYKRLARMETDMEVQGEQIKKAMTLAESIKEDTEAMVAFWQGMTLTRKFLQWFIPLAVGVVSSVVTYWRTKGG